MVRHDHIGDQVVAGAIVMGERRFDLLRKMLVAQQARAVPGVQSRLVFSGEQAVVFRRVFGGQSVEGVIWERGHSCPRLFGRGDTLVPAARTGVSLLPGSVRDTSVPAPRVADMRRQPRGLLLFEFVEHSLREGIGQTPRNETQRRTLLPVRQVASVAVDVGEGVEKR